MLRITAQALENATERERARQRAQSSSAEHAWRTLEVTRASVDRADAKAGAVIAASGITSATLFSLVGTHRSEGWWVIAVLAACAASALAAAFCAAMALRPRRHRKTEPTSLLYFDHVARMPGFSAEDYVRRARGLFSDLALLCDQIAAEVWAVAKISAVKYAWVDRALFFLMINLLTLGTSSIIFAI